MFKIIGSPRAFSVVSRRGQKKKYTWHKFCRVVNKEVWKSDRLQRYKRKEEKADHRPRGNQEVNHPLSIFAGGRLLLPRKQARAEKQGQKYPRHRSAPV